MNPEHQQTIETINQKPDTDRTLWEKRLLQAVQEMGDEIDTQEETTLNTLISLNQIIETINQKPDTDRTPGERKLLQAVQDMGDKIDSQEEITLNSLILLYKSSKIIGEKQLLDLMTNLEIGILREEVGENGDLSVPVEGEEEVVEPVEEIDTEEEVVEPVEEIDTEEEVVEPVEEDTLSPTLTDNRETNTSDLEERIRNTIVLDSLDSQLSKKFLDVFVQEYQETIKSDPERYISKEGNIFGGNSFLKEILGQTVSQLSDGEKSELSDMYFEFKGFYIGRNEQKERVVSNTPYRVYLLPYIEERKPFEADQLLLSLREDKGIPDTQLRNYIFDMFQENIFGSQDTYEIGDLSIDLDTQKEIILQNIETLIRFIMDMESSFGRNLQHQVSSAKGRLQYLNGESHGIVNLGTYSVEQGKYTSLHTGINKALITLRGSKVQTEKSQSVQEFFRNAQEKVTQTYLYSTLDFSTEEEILLYILELLCQAKSDKKRFRGLTKGLIEFLLLGDEQQMTELYKKYHHRNPDQGTLNSIARKLPRHSEKLQSVISNEQIPSFKIYSLLDSSSTLKEGNSGENIRTLQRILGILGYPVDGVSLGNETTTFGPATKKALINFQVHTDVISSRSNSAAGLFGPGTRRKMKQLLEPILQGTSSEVSIQDVVSIFEGNSTGISIPAKEVITEPVTDSTILLPSEVKEVDFKATDLDVTTELFKKKKPDRTIIDTIYNTKDDGGSLLYRRNYSRRVKPFYDSPGVPMNVEDFKTAESLLNEGKLVSLQKETNLWKLDASIVGKSIDRPALLYVTPHTQVIIIEILQEFQRRLQEDYGLQDGWNVRVMLNSLLRPRVYNMKIRGASEASAHIRGIGFDIAHNRFEVYNQNGEYVRVTDRAQDQERIGVDVNIPMTKSLVAVLYGVLRDFDSEGKIIFTKEGSHPHVTVKETNQSQ